MKYPIGTKIRFVQNGQSMHSVAKQDIGKTGVILGKVYGNYVAIHLPSSNHNFTHLSKYDLPLTWTTPWECVELAIEPGQQLLFSFMEE